MDSIAYAYAAMTAAPAQARAAAPMLAQSAPMLVQHGQAGPIGVADVSRSVRLVPVMAANAAVRIKGQVSPTPVDTFSGVWSPPPRRAPL